MKRSCISVVFVLLCVTAFSWAPSSSAEQAFTDNFNLDKAELTPTGRNPYFILEPGYQLSYQSRTGALTVTVLDETKVLDGVETRVVEERELHHGKLSEVSRNYFAISKRTNGIFYFGEDVDNYDRNGQVIDHEGSWRAGVNGAKAGLLMPGRPLIGARHYQELAPKAAMDRAEVVSLTETLKTPAGQFDNVLKTEETSKLEPRSREYKWYAYGVGLIKDGEFELVKYGEQNA